MPRDLIRFTPEETKRIIVHQDGETFSVEDAGQIIAGLNPGSVMDFIKLPDGKRTMVVSDVPIEDASQLVEGAEFVPLEEVEVEVEAGSWSLPLCLPAILARSMDDKDSAWIALEQLAGRYLELGAWSDQTKPWKDGLVAAIVRANWDEWKKIGAVEGESHWGWIKGRYFIHNGGESWNSVKIRFEGWMRAADVFLRNTEDREWIAGLTLNQILEVPISKAIRCCGAISDGLFSHYLVGPSLQRALFDMTVGSTGMNHLIAKKRVEREEVPERVVDEETGEIEYVIPATGEVVDEDELDEYLPKGIIEEIDVPERPRGKFWTYNPTMQAFGYYDEGMEWTIGLSVQTDSLEVRRFVDRIIAACGVAADYNGS